MTFCPARSCIVPRICSSVSMSFQTHSGAVAYSRGGDANSLRAAAASIGSSPNADRSLRKNKRQCHADPPAKLAAVHVSCSSDRGANQSVTVPSPCCTRSSARSVTTPSLCGCLVATRRTAGRKMATSTAKRGGSIHATRLSNDTTHSHSFRRRRRCHTDAGNNDGTGRQISRPPIRRRNRPISANRSSTAYGRLRLSTHTNICAMNKTACHLMALPEAPMTGVSYWPATWART